MANIEREVAAALLREYGWEPRIVGVGDPGGYGGWERIAKTALEAADHRPAVDHMRESQIARARGLAQAIAECRDDARLDGIREGAAEIITLLGGR